MGSFCKTALTNINYKLYQLCDFRITSVQMAWSRLTTRNRKASASIAVAGTRVFVSKTSQSVCSYRLCFDGFRRRKPGPPPFSSMNSTPAFSKARLTTSRVARRGWLASFSKWWMVMMPTPARSAKVCWLQLSKPLAALHWADVIIPQSSATR